jgi:hypothetical protein
VKKLFCAFVLYFCTIILYAEIPRSGRYIFEIIGAEDTFNVEISGSKWTFISDDGAEEETTVSVNTRRKTISIPIFAEIADPFLYEEKEPCIDFYLYYDQDSNPLMGYFLDSMSLDDMLGINSVTDDFAYLLIEKFTEIFRKLPIMRLKR